MIGGCSTWRKERLAVGVRAGDEAVAVHSFIVGTHADLAGARRPAEPPAHTPPAVSIRSQKHVKKTLSCCAQSHAAGQGPGGRAGWLGTTAILQHGDREYICMPRSVPIFGYLDSLGTLANRAS